MRLYNGPTSPFGRKVSVLYRELGLAVEEVEINVYTAEFLDVLNPLRQIPTLELTDGRTIYDSSVISLYLMELAARPDLLPDDTKFEVLTTCSLADGLMEAVLQRRMESLRPEKERSADTTSKLELRIGRALGALAVAVISLFNSAGRLFWGTLSDRIGRARTVLAIFLLQVPAFALMPAIHHFAVLLLPMAWPSLRMVKNINTCGAIVKRMLRTAPSAITMLTTPGCDEPN